MRCAGFGRPLVAKGGNEQLLRPLLLQPSEDHQRLFKEEKVECGIIATISKAVKSLKTSVGGAPGAFSVKPGHLPACSVFHFDESSSLQSLTVVGSLLLRTQTVNCHQKVRLERQSGEEILVLTAMKAPNLGSPWPPTTPQSRVVAYIL